MRFLSILLVSALALSVAEAAAAKDVCLRDGFENVYVFRGVKKLKPGGSTPLSGTYFFALGDSQNPIFGTAVMTPNREIKVGAFIHTFVTGNWTISMTLDEDWAAGTGAEDADGDFSADAPDTYTFERIDCKTALTPPG